MTIDFTSARFLGSGTYETIAVPGSGKPAALEEPQGALSVAGLLARRQRAECGLLSRSTLHALIDVFSVLRAGDGPVLVDEHAYPITGWAAAAAQGGAGPVIPYRHHDARDAARLLRLHRGTGPGVLVADAWCANCLEPAPLAELSRSARRAGVPLVVDDSLAFGVLGARRDDRDCFGSGGSGTLAWLGLNEPGILWVASASKTYGVSLCVVTGSRPHLTALQRDGPSRMHAGPPSVADIALLEAQLADPAADDQRRRLAGLVAAVRDGCERAGYVAVGRPFPVVGLRSSRYTAAELHQSLEGFGIRSLVVRSECSGSPMLALCLRADHTDAQVAALLTALTLAHRRRR